MDKSKLLVIGTALVALAVLIAFSQGFLNPSGLFGLSAEETQLEKAGKANGEEAENTADQKTVKAGLSFEVLRPTSIEASIVGEAILPNCPKEAEIEIIVKNTGNDTAEKMYFSFGSGIKIVGCSNCELDKLLPSQEITAKARLCLESSSANAVTVGSANSNKIELNFE